jgi:hypothetical protein
MSIVTNKFFISAVDDGSTMTATLSKNMALSQSYSPNNGGVWMPNFTTDSPILTPYILKGATRLQPTTQNWYCNGILLAFDTTTKKCTTPIYVNVFQLITDANGYECLKIIDNLAKPGNLDADSIMLEGTVEFNGAQVEFAVRETIMLTEVQGNGYSSTFTFSPSNTITERGQTITITGKLYANGAEYTGNYDCNWYLNDSSAVSATGKTLTLQEANVVDYVVIKCEFIIVGTERTKVLTSYTSVDDASDNDQMQVSCDIRGQGTNNGNSATLHADQIADIKFWMAYETNKAIGSNNKFTTYSVKLFNTKMESNIGAQSINTIVLGSDGSDGYKNVTTTDSDTGVPIGSLSVSYDNVIQCGGNISGILKAQ